MLGDTTKQRSRSVSISSFVFIIVKWRRCSLNYSRLAAGMASLADAACAIMTATGCCSCR